MVHTFFYVTYLLNLFFIEKYLLNLNCSSNNKKYTE